MPPPRFLEGTSSKKAFSNSLCGLTALSWSLALQLLLTPLSDSMYSLFRAYFVFMAIYTVAVHTTLSTNYIHPHILQHRVHTQVTFWNLHA